MALEDETIQILRYVMLVTSSVSTLASALLLVYFVYRKRLWNILFMIISLINIGMLLYSLNQLILTLIVLYFGNEYLKENCSIYGFSLIFSLNFQYLWIILLGVLVGKALQREQKKMKWLRMRYLLPASLFISISIALIPLFNESYGDDGRLMVCYVDPKKSKGLVIQTIFVQTLPLVSVIGISVYMLFHFRMLFKSTGFNQYLRQFIFCLLSLPIQALIATILFMVRLIVHLKSFSDAALYAELLEYCFINITGTIISIMYGSLMKNSLQPSFAFNAYLQNSCIAQLSQTQPNQASDSEQLNKIDGLVSKSQTIEQSEQKDWNEQNYPSYYVSLEEANNHCSHYKTSKIYRSAGLFQRHNFRQQSRVRAIQDSIKGNEGERVAIFLMGTLKNFEQPTKDNQSIATDQEQQNSKISQPLIEKDEEKMQVFYSQREEESFVNQETQNNDFKISLNSVASAVQESNVKNSQIK